MASGRLGNCLIPAYGSAQLYCNSSGQSASITISAQVLDENTNSEISVNVGSSSTTLNQNTILTTEGCYCRLIGYNLNENNYCYYGAFSAPTIGNACTWSARYIESNGTVTVGFTTSCCCDIPLGGNEIINPTLRIDCPASFNLPYNQCTGLNTILGFVPACGASSSWFILTKYTTPNENCAGKNIVNPQCSTLYNCPAGICCSSLGSSTFNYYSLDSLIRYNVCCVECCSACCCVCSYVCKNCDDNPLGIQRSISAMYFYHLCARSATCTSGVACCCSNVCAPNTLSINTCCISFCVLDNFGCTTSAFECNICTNPGGFRISPFGVYSAMTKDTAIFVHATRGTEQKYLLMPTNYCLYATQSCLCHNKLVDLYINNPNLDRCELAVKYLSYNPNSDCVYIMSRSPDVNSCGIFSINLSQLCSCYAIYIGGASCACVSCLNLSATPLFCRVSDFPTIMTCTYYTDPLMCVSCLFRFAKCGWSMSLYNSSTCLWDTFITDNLINWCLTNNEYQYKSSDTLQIKSATSCVVSCCNCFMSNVDPSGMLDYKVSANNYERTGVVISNGDRINVNNNSDKCMSVQVWGYEG